MALDSQMFQDVPECSNAQKGFSLIGPHMAPNETSTSSLSSKFRVDALYIYIYGDIRIQEKGNQIRITECLVENSIPRF